FINRLIRLTLITSPIPAEKGTSNPLSVSVSAVGDIPDTLFCEVGPLRVGRNPEYCHFLAAISSFRTLPSPLLPIKPNPNSINQRLCFLTMGKSILSRFRFAPVEYFMQPFGCRRTG